MNSIEALIAIIALIASMGILLQTINLQNETFQNATNILRAKTNSLNCAFIIDSIISNSAKEYTNELNCTAKENVVNSKINEIDRNSLIIGTANSELTLSVNTFEHYK
jgi:archaellum component FlaF (FlaF/FlaG flagellin family)